MYVHAHESGKAHVWRSEENCGQWLSLSTILGAGAGPLGFAASTSTYWAVLCEHGHMCTWRGNRNPWNWRCGWFGSTMWVPLHPYSILSYILHGIQFHIWRASTLTPLPPLASKTSSLSTSWFAAHRYPSPATPWPWITVFCTLLGASASNRILREFMAGPRSPHKTNPFPEFFC